MSEAALASSATPVTTQAPVDAKPTQNSSNPELNTTAGEKSAAQSAIEKYRLKVDGQDMDVDLDELKKGYTRASAAQKRFDEAAKMRKEAEAIKKEFEEYKLSLKSKPIEMLKKEGINTREEAEKFLANELKMEMMSPEERRAIEAEKKLKQYEDQEKEFKTKQEQAEYEKLVETNRQDYETRFMGALESLGLPPHPDTLYEMSKAAMICLDAGYDPDPSDLAAMVKDKMINSFKGIFDKMSGEQLAQFLGDDVGKKIRQYDLGKLKSSMQTQTQKVSLQETETKPKKPMTEQQWRDHIYRKAGMTAD